MDKKEYMKKYRESHKEQIKAQRKAYNEAHREQRKAYKEAHKDEIKAKNKAYRESHKEQKKAYNEAHKDEIKVYMKAYHELNKEQIREQLLRKYCTDLELIENYEQAKSDNFKGWHLHHRLETHTSDGERRLVDLAMEELIALGMYYNRSASELIFLVNSEHSKLHNKGKHYKIVDGKRVYY